MQLHESDEHPYLQQEVLTASPLKLRWMLIQRAESLCGIVNQLWSVGEDLQAAGWILRIREILGELLEGIKDRDNPVSQQVSDFYVFLLQLLNRIEKTKDAKQLKTLEELLHIENETWQQVVQKSQTDVMTTGATPFPRLNLPIGENSADYSGGLSIEI